MAMSTGRKDFKTLSPAIGDTCSDSAWFDWMKVNVLNSGGFTFQLGSVVIGDVVIVRVEQVEDINGDTQILRDVEAGAVVESQRAVGFDRTVFGQRAWPEVAAAQCGEESRCGMLKGNAGIGYGLQGAGNLVAIVEFGMG